MLAEYRRRMAHSLGIHAWSKWQDWFSNACVKTSPRFCLAPGSRSLRTITVQSQAGLQYCQAFLAMLE
jgi:hypothetical protein